MAGLRAITMKQYSRGLRNQILSMRVNNDEWGVIRDCAQKRGVRVSEVMRDAMRMIHAAKFRSYIRKGVLK
jgi:hypothetical protein